MRESKGINYDIEIIVVDNASTDRTSEIAKKYRGVKVVKESEMGLPRARQAGFLAASGDLIANVDADTILTPGWIGKVLSEFSKNPKLVALSGPHIPYDLPKRMKVLADFFYRIGFVAYIFNRFIFDVGSMLQGGNFIVRRKALESIGGYNTDIDFYGEDTDLARRLHKVGPVKFTFDLPIYASGRRLAKEGAFTTGIRYSLNYFWTIFFKKPFSETSYIAIRPTQKIGKLKYRPASRTHKTKEWLIASAFAVILLALIAKLGLTGYHLLQNSVIATITIPEIKAETEKMDIQLRVFSYEIKSALSRQLKHNGVQ